MKVRCRQHVNPLSMSLLAPRPPLTLPPQKIVEVELGCADARFLIERAERFPERHFVGLDIRHAFLEQAIEATEKRSLGNVQLEVCNLLVDLPHLFSPGRIDRFFINFPDPWFKPRHRNRRWLDAAALDELVTAATPGGEIFFQSDYWPLALDALGLLEAHPRLTNGAAASWSFLRTNPFGARSTRDHLSSKEGRRVWRLLFKKGAASPPTDRDEPR